MRNNCRIVRSRRKAHRFEGFSQRADLIHLHENRIGNTSFYPLLQALRIRDEKVVSNELKLATKRISKLLPSIPIVLRHAVFYGNDRKLLRPARPELDHLLRSLFALVRLPEDVFPFALFVEFARGGI